MKFIIPILFTIIAMVVMAAALHFSRYKKRGSGCCGGDLPADYKGRICDKNDTQVCICDGAKE